MQLLSNGGAASHNFEIKLGQVLVYQCHSSVLGTHIRWVVWAWDLPKRKQPPRLLLLEPRHVCFNVPELADSLPLHYANCGAGVHTDARLHTRATKVREQCEDSKSLG